MSRTYRYNRLSHKSKTREGLVQYYSSGCKHHGSCPYCRSTRTHASSRRQPIELQEDLELDIWYNLPLGGFSKNVEEYKAEWETLLLPFRNVGFDVIDYNDKGVSLVTRSGRGVMVFIPTEAVLLLSKMA